MTKWSELANGMDIALPCGCEGRVSVITDLFMVLRKWRAHGIPDEDIRELGQNHPVDEKIHRQHENILFPVRTAKAPEWFLKREAEKWIEP